MDDVMVLIPDTNHFSQYIGQGLLENILNLVLNWNYTFFNLQKPTKASFYTDRLIRKGISSEKVWF